MNPFDDQGVFGPKTLAILTHAYKDACRDLKQNSANGSTMREAKLALAKRIFDRAKKGERDPDRLRAYGLRGLIHSA